MQTNATLTVKNGSVVLPKNVRSAWNNASVDVRVSDDTLVIKKIERPEFWTTFRKLKKLKGGIAKQDIADAVAWARKNKK